LPHERIILYGRSMGGAAALRAVAELGVRPDAMILESVFDSLTSTVGNRFAAMGLPRFPLAELLVFWGGVQNGYNAFGLNPAEYAAHVHCPALLFQGGRDLRVSDEQARNIFDHLAGPKRLELFPASSHCTFLADDPVRWTKAVRAILADDADDH